MYEFRIDHDGEKFSIYNTTREKVVFSGKDNKLKEKDWRVAYKFKNVEDLMSSISTWISLSTFKKISKMLRPG